MKTFKLLAILLLFVSFISCDKDDDTFDSKDLIIGSWVSPQYMDETYELVRYDRSESLINDYGFTFVSDLTFIERKNSGWCGTPPISYSDYTGDWNKTDSIVNIVVGYWGGSVNYVWKVQSVNSESLIIKRVDETYSEPQ